MIGNVYELDENRKPLPALKRTLKEKNKKYSLSSRKNDLLKCLSYRGVDI